MIAILGHRGVKGDKLRPENSLAALEEGLRRGDGIETDISVSRDGTAYLVHDIGAQYVPYLFTRSRYLRPGPDGRRLSQRTDAEIGAEHPQLSTLFTIAARYPGKIINLELKGEGADEATVRAVHQAIAAGQVRREQVIVSSFDVAALRRVRELDPDLACGLILLPRGTRAAPIYPWAPDMRDRLYRDFSRATWARADVRALAPDYIVTRPPSAAGLRDMRRDCSGARLILWSHDGGALARAAQSPDAAPVLAAVIGGDPAGLSRMIRP